MNNKKSNIPRFAIPKTLGQSVYEYLKESILKKEFEPNQRINKKAIAERFQVSSTPIREALVRLASEGFVEIISNRVYLVKEISYKELKERFQVIRVLDRLAASLIFDQINSQGLTKLEKMTKKMERYYIMREVEKFLDVDYIIHGKLWDYLTEKNNFLQKELHACIDQIKMCIHPLKSAFEDPKIIKKSMNVHKEIMGALKKKNKAKLETIIFEHWTLPFKENF